MQPNPVKQISLEVQLLRATALLRAANRQLGRDFGVELDSVKLSALDEITENEALLGRSTVSRSEA